MYVLKKVMQKDQNYKNKGIFGAIGSAISSAASAVGSAIKSLFEVEPNPFNTDLEKDNFLKFCSLQALQATSAGWGRSKGNMPGGGLPGNMIGFGAMNFLKDKHAGMNGVADGMFNVGAAAQYHHHMISGGFGR